MLLQMALFRSFCGWAAFHDIQAPHLYLLSCQWPFRLFPRLGWASLVAQRLKRLPPMRETWVRSLGWEDPLEKEMAIHSSILAWRIPWTEKPSRLPSMGSQRVGHDWVISLSLCIMGLFSPVGFKASSTLWNTINWVCARVCEHMCRVGCYKGRTWSGG